MINRRQTRIGVEASAIPRLFRKCLPYALTAAVSLAPGLVLAQDKVPSELDDATGLAAECDTDLDGAAIGAGIGSLPLWVAALNDDGGEGGYGLWLLGIAGAIAGFWGGLAIDSLDCDEPGAPHTGLGRNGKPEPPQVPSKLSAVDSGYAQLDLAWIDNSDGEEGFRIERRERRTGTWVVIGTVGTDRTTYSDMNATRGIEYCYRVTAFSDGVASSSSNEACASWS